MKAVEAGEQRVRVALDVFVVLTEDAAEEFVFIVMDGLDDEAIVAREMEERARLAGRAKLERMYLTVSERESSGSSWK